MALRGLLRPFKISFWYNLPAFFENESIVNYRTPKDISKHVKDVPEHLDKGSYIRRPASSQYVHDVAQEVSSQLELVQ